MKINLFLLAFLIISISYSQDDNKNKEEDKITYNRWSIDFGVGANKPTKGLTPGYYAGTFENLSAELGARYMFNDRVGLRLNAIYNNFQEGDNSPEFNSEFIQFNIDGVVNLRQLLELDDFTQKFNLLATGGLGYGFTSFDDSSTLSDANTDNVVTANAGLIPQYKISDKFALDLNLGLSGVIRQNHTFDGNSLNSRKGFGSINYRATIGFSVYLGKEKEHADWVDASSEAQYEKKAEKLKDRISKLENDLKDTDKDGIPDYLDREPSTPNGVAVNNKGQSIDKNQNGVPDELEDVMNEKYVSSDDVQKMKESSDVAKTLANKGYINVYFRFNSAKPETYSLNAVNQIVEYMRANPQANAILTGYTDAIGNEEYNLKLSKDRAKRVYEILVASGIKESRISYKGGGEDDSVDKSSSAARQLTRRVKFELR